MRLINFISGFFKDKEGKPSRKALVMYICIYFFWILIDASIDGKPIDQMVLFTVAGLILFSIGAVTSEFFNNFPKK